MKNHSTANQTLQTKAMEILPAAILGGAPHSSGQPQPRAKGCPSRKQLQERTTAIRAEPSGRQRQRGKQCHGDQMAATPTAPQPLGEARPPIRWAAAKAGPGHPPAEAVRAEPLPARRHSTGNRDATSHKTPQPAHGHPARGIGGVQASGGPQLARSEHGNAIPKPPMPTGLARSLVTK